MSTAPSRSPLRTRRPGLQLGPRLEDADRGRRGDDPVQIRAVVGRALTGRRSAPSRARPASRRSRTVAGAGALHLAGAAVALEAARAHGHDRRARAAIATAGRSPAGRARARVAGPPDADGPGPLADLDLAETARRQLGDQGRDEILREPVDGGMVGCPGVGRVAARARTRSEGVGRWSSVTGIRPRHGPAARRGDRPGSLGSPDQRPGSSRLRRRSARPGRSGSHRWRSLDLAIGAQRSEPTVARFDELVERDRREGVELLDDDRPDPAGGLGVVGVGTLARLGDDDVDDPERLLVGRRHLHRDRRGRAPRRRCATGSRRNPRG